MTMTARSILILLFFCQAACAAESSSGNCLEITLTGTQGGPPAVNGLAGSGTLVQYGSVANDCSDVLLQFDAGRSTTESLSALNISALRLDAVFLTHMHSDHVEGLADLLQYRWHFLGDSLDVVCSADAETNEPPPARTMSCKGLVTHTADALIAAGEIAQRVSENRKRHPDGPAALVNLREVELPLPSKPGFEVWRSGKVVVTAIGTTHIAGSLAYRVDTPAGSVVVGGDAGNSVLEPPRQSSTSETVEALAEGADVLVHSAMHTIFAPGAGSTFPAVAYYRQSNVADLAALAKRAGVRNLMLTHLIPSLSSATHGPYQIPGGALTSADYEAATAASGYTGEVYVGTDGMHLRLNQKN